jgi:hypothetical protein
MEAVFCQLFTRRVTDKDGKAHTGALELLEARYKVEGRLPALEKVLETGCLVGLVAAFTRLKGKADDPLLKGSFISAPFLNGRPVCRRKSEALAATLGGYHETTPQSCSRRPSGPPDWSRTLRDACARSMRTSAEGRLVAE